MHPAAPKGGPQCGLSLISTVATLVTLGLLGALVVSALDDMGKSDPQTRSLLNEVGITGGAGTGTDDTAAPSARGPAGLVQGASVQECQADLATLETAVSAYMAQAGSNPTTTDDLVTAGFLSSLPSRPSYAFSLEAVDGQPTGRVMVNGRPGVEGCHAPAARSVP